MAARPGVFPEDGHVPMCVMVSGERVLCDNPARCHQGKRGIPHLHCVSGHVHVLDAEGNILDAPAGI